MSSEKLLTRDAFREAVFERDGHKCVFCGASDVHLDAHHILERRLWSDGGYYLSNGATVCQVHHLLCESTDLTVEQVREAAKIAKWVLPEHLYSDQVYDKWANVVLPNGQRLRGELFWDESVQQVLSSHLHEFTNRVKYPRTYHLPWSENMSDDDRMVKSLEAFVGKEVVVTVKMDGENTTMYSDYIHARSVDGRSHPSRDWVKNFHSRIAHDIPQDWRLCGENLYAEHSIRYEGLKSYFMGFSIWDDRNVCLGWDNTLEWFELLGVEPVTTLYRGTFDETLIRGIKGDWSTMEGYVLRLADSFSYRDFRRSVAKYVRKDHIRTVKHWMHGQPIVPNGLAV